MLSQKWVFTAYAFAVTSVVAGIWTSPANAQTVRWDMSMEDRPNSLPGEGAVAFAEDLKARTDGRIEVTVHHSGSLGFKNVDHLNALKDGVLPLAQSLAGTFSGQEPLFLLSSLPFIAHDLEDARALLEAARPAYEDAFARHGQKYLYSSPFPPTGIWASKRLASNEDFAGLKVRTYDVSGTATFRNLGATPVQVSFSDIIPQLSTGNIDSVLTSADGGRSLKFWEFMTHFNDVGYAFPLNVTAVSQSAFDALPDDLKDAVIEAGKAAEERDWAAITTWEESNNAVLTENQVEIVKDFPPELLATLSEAGTQAIDDWLSKVSGGQEILDSYNATRAQQ